MERVHIWPYTVLCQIKALHHLFKCRDNGSYISDQPLCSVLYYILDTQVGHGFGFLFSGTIRNNTKENNNNIISKLLLILVVVEVIIILLIIPCCYYYY